MIDQVDRRQEAQSRARGSTSRHGRLSQMSQPSDSAGKPSVLFVYLTYTKQTLKDGLASRLLVSTSEHR